MNQKNTIKFNFLRLNLLLALLGVPLHEGLAEVPGEAQMAKPQSIDLDDRIEASLETAQNEAIRVLLLASVLAQRDYLPKVVEVPEAIKEKYEVTRMMLMGGAPTIAGTTYFFGRSLFKAVKEIEFTSQWANRIWSSLKPASAWSGRRWDGFVKSRIVRALGRSAQKSGRLSYNWISPQLRLVFRKGAKTVMSVTSLGGALYGLVYLSRHNAREAMTSEMARSIMGYDREFESKLNKLLSRTATVFGLEPFETALLRAGIRKDLMDQAIANEFRIENPDGTPVDYSIDVVKIMTVQGIIPVEVSEAAERIGKVVNQSWSGDATQSTLDSLDGSMATILETAMLLESILATSDFSQEMEMQVRQRLANVQKTLLRLKSNLNN